MSTYDLPVRGETVHIEFTRINDSRRLALYSTTKKPNLFKIRGAMGCRLNLPFSLSPYWWQHSPVCAGRQLTLPGVGFCHSTDGWNSQQGRNRALADALKSSGCEGVLVGEIVAAFMAEYAERTKVKEPRFTPKTAKPKAQRADRRSTLERIADALEKLIDPQNITGGGDQGPDIIASLEKADALLLSGADFAEFPSSFAAFLKHLHVPKADAATAPPAENIHPVDTANPTNLPPEVLYAGMPTAHCQWCENLIPWPHSQPFCNETCAANWKATHKEKENA